MLRRAALVAVAAHLENRVAGWVPAHLKAAYDEEFRALRQALA
jgi:hypothetical protein